MFSEIWIFIETVTLICMYCFLYREILNGTMQEEKKKAEAAVKDAEELKVVIRKMNEETITLGFYFKQNNGRFDAYHTNQWHAEEKERRQEIEKLRKDVHHFDKMTDKMISLAKKHNMEFEFKNGRCVALVQK
jgi:tellurite resistance protein